MRDFARPPFRPRLLASALLSRGCRKEATVMRKEKGFTLIELLIVVAIIGIIAAMAIPNLMNAIDKGKQKRTMADLRTLGSAVEMYAVENNTYPRVASYVGLQPLIQPTYIRTTSASDGWNHPWV